MISGIFFAIAVSPVMIDTTFLISKLETFTVNSQDAVGSVVGSVGAADVGSVVGANISSEPEPEPRAVGVEVAAVC